MQTQADRDPVASGEPEWKEAFRRKKAEAEVELQRIHREAAEKARRLEEELLNRRR